MSQRQNNKLATIDRSSGEAERNLRRDTSSFLFILIAKPPTLSWLWDSHFCQGLIYAYDRPVNDATLLAGQDTGRVMSDGNVSGLDRPVVGSKVP